MIRYLFFIFVFIISCSPSSQLDYSHIKVINVIDGDTVRLENGRLLRYIGIDTPEIRIKRNGRFVYDPQPFALDAKEFNRKLVEGKYVRIEFDVQRTDKYGRLLGYCFVDKNGVFVNGELIRQGYAVLYTYPPNVKYVDLLVRLQKQARKNKRGLWGAYEVVDSDEAYKYINQIRTVKGKVLSTYQSSQSVFLNFGRDYRTDFTIVIFDNVLKSFYDRGIDPVSFYRGKIVEVTGRIREYNGPEIIVNSPYQIKVLSDEE